VCPPPSDSWVESRRAIFRATDCGRRLAAKNWQLMGSTAAAAALVVVQCLTAPILKAGDAPDVSVTVVRVPVGLPSVPYPQRNLPTPEKIALGAKLFSDPRLSIDATISCASCHDPKQAFTNPNPPRRAGVADTRLRRDVTSLFNVAYASPLHHDGGEPSLEVQILAPLFNAAEMGNVTFRELTSRLAAIPEYRDAFQTVFGGPPTIETIGFAIANFERSLLAGNSPFDRWHLGGDDTAVDAEAKAGFTLFSGKARCNACHALREGAVTFTDNGFHSTGTGFRGEARSAAETPEASSDRGREEVTHKRDDRYKFRTPTLRNVELTAPYMHDGSLKTLEDVIADYNAGGSPDPEKDPRIKPLGLTDTEQKQLVAFLKSLTSKTLPGGGEQPP
jgi:cytochrome c peroxidase